MGDLPEFSTRQKQLRKLYRFVAEQVLAGLFKTEVVEKLMELGVDQVTAGDLVDEMAARIKARRQKALLVFLPAAGPGAALRRELRAVGFQVGEGAPERPLRSWLEEVVPDLVIVEHRPPERDAHRMVREIRQHPLGRKMPVVVLSDRQAARESFAAQGRVECVFSPWKPEELAGQVARVLAVPKLYEWENWEPEDTDTVQGPG